MNTIQKFNARYDLLKDRFQSVRVLAREEKKLYYIRMAYTLSRFICIGIPIRLRNDKKLAIIGCGRSATRFVSKLFQNLGIQIGHERLEKHGISSWTLVPNTGKMVWGPSYSLIRHLHMPLVHQVRNPLDVISSVKTVFSDQKTWDFIAEFIPINKNDSPLLKSMKYWYYWNVLAEEKSVYTYRVENIDHEMKTLLEIGKYQIPENLRSAFSSISTKINTREHSLLSLNDLKRTDAALTEKIIGLGIKYGYHF